MTWGVEVLVYDRSAKASKWRRVGQSGSQYAYSYPTREEAERVARMCYPDLGPDEVRVVEDGGAL